MSELLILSIYLVAYAGVHSLLATERLKSRIHNCCPGFFRHYRLSYSIVSVLTLYPLFFLLRHSPVLYHVTGPPALLMRIVQILAALGFAYAARSIDLDIFLGYRQPAPASAGPDQPLSTDGPYRICRHPLYFFASLFLATQPIVSHAYAVFTVWTISYFWIGSWIEERRLLSQFGDTYRTYKQEVPHFLPIPRKRSK